MRTASTAGMVLQTHTQESLDFFALSALQVGWQFDVAQLSPARGTSAAQLIQSDQACLVPMRLNSKFDQKLVSRAGYINFGLPAVGSTPIWVGSQAVTADKLVLFPVDDQAASASIPGFDATAIHLQLAQVEDYLQLVYHRNLDDLLARTGANPLNPADRAALDRELNNWHHLAKHTHLASDKLLQHREDTLVQLILSSMLSAGAEIPKRRLKSERAMDRALQIIHDEPLGSVTVSRLCKEADCSISALEYSFNNRFGVTPKRYMKNRQLSHARKALFNFDKHGYKSITDLATRHGFWHMGQFSADYRKLFGELPSKTVD